MAKAVNINLGYKPRGFQRTFHKGCREKSHAVLICARQHGKTEVACMELIHRALAGPEGVSYAFAAPFAHQARKVGWPRFKKLLGGLGDYVSFRETDLILTLPGNRRIHCIGLDNEGCRGQSFRGVIVDEHDDVDEEIYVSALLPTMASFKDAFLLHIGTLKRNGKLWKLYQERKDDEAWYCQVTKATDAGVMSEEQLDRFRLEMGDSAYLREFQCDPDAPVSNSVVGDLMSTAEIEDRVPNSLPVQGVGDVHLAFDLGLRDATAIWAFQLCGHSIHLVDYWEFSGIGLVEIGNRLRKTRYRWGSVVLPHDIAVRDYSTGISRLQTFIDLDIGRPEPLKRASVEDGLNAIRLNLSRCVFAGDKCEMGIGRLKQARYAVDSKTGTILNKVVHDDSSHCLDAFRYLCSWIERRYPSTGRLAGQSFREHGNVPIKVKTTIVPRRRAI